MKFRPMPICLSLALLASTIGLPFSSAYAANVWRAKMSGSFVTLRYGPLDEREKAPFLLSCLNGVGIAVLSVHMDFPEQRRRAEQAVESYGIRADNVDAVIEEIMKRFI